MMPEATRRERVKSAALAAAALSEARKFRRGRTMH